MALAGHAPRLEHGRSAVDAAPDRAFDRPDRILFPAASTPRRRVVIVGAGFAGLQAAKALATTPVDIVLIDQKNHHCFQPLLYQVATASLSPADIAWPIRSILRNQRNADVMLARVIGVDRSRNVVRTTAGEIAYDYLVLATGATHHYFGHQEWEKVAPGLKSIEDATRIRSHILKSFEAAELARDLQTQRRLMTFIIVGGGPTGVEMAGAIAEVARQTLRRDFRHIDPAEASIILLEAGPRLLPAFPEKLAASARRALEAAGVDLRIGAQVTTCDAAGVVASDERILAGTVIWAAGVKASPAAEWLGAPRDRNGRVAVSADLSVAGSDNIFVIGDTAAASIEGRPVPGVAPAAKQMGEYVGRLIAARISGNPAIGPFRYRDYGALATIGRRYAIVKIGRFELTGLAAWLFWSVVHIYYLIGARNRAVVALAWIWNYLTFERGARLINS
jgi:NADH:quinone reductase (non-electrogenic)